MPPVF
ncbi:hypothetical protein D039_5163A, partial [Vibrio parahaemolyticus EKP-028]